VLPYLPYTTGVAAIGLAISAGYWLPALMAFGYASPIYVSIQDYWSGGLPYVLALVLPASLPVWMGVVGAVFSIAIVKEAFGGLGHNIFNPALGARAFLTLCFPSDMTNWTAPSGFRIDAVTTATPLSERFVWEASKSSLYGDMLLGNTGGSLGATSALLIGSVYWYRCAVHLDSW
jgi:electron transport complex protein RnfD